MSRLPFDPKQARGAGDSQEPPARREGRRYADVSEAEHLSVSQLAEVIRRTLEERIASPIRVRGEISNLRSQHHWYFSLKDEDAVVSCVAWASSARRFDFEPNDGDEIIVVGHVGFYAPQGRTQLYVTAIQAVGEGTLERRFRALCEHLRSQGYFAEERKRRLPTFPRRIAVITSATGAALQDVISTARQRCPAVGLLVVGVRVQGDGAADQVARAIRWVDARHTDLGVEAILVTRGGGSIEDLWAFNELAVAEATHACSIPIVAAIGHESDTTVIELVADRRASTPTQAAMILVPASDELRQQVDHASQRLTTLIRRRIEDAVRRLATIERHVVFADPGALVRRGRERLQAARVSLRRTITGRLAVQRARVETLAARLATVASPQGVIGARQERIAILADRLDRVIGQHLERTRRRVNELERHLIAVDPRSVLGRGFSYTLTSDGRLVQSVSQVTSGDVIKTHVADGAIASTVGDSGGTGGRAPRRRRPSDEPGPGLFEQSGT